MKTMLCMVGLLGLLAGCGGDVRELSAREVQARYSFAFCTKDVVSCDNGDYEDCLAVLADSEVWSMDPRLVTEAEMEECEVEMAVAPCDVDVYANLESCDFWTLDE